ncbi:hypothetical protein [Streptomyces sp. NPDC048606]|uniref:hypothetical protein n=1 Tax=Streptomyces sp. NPDC048606 TaxID=3154726 RepID=UPI0034293931
MSEPSEPSESTEETTASESSEPGESGESGELVEIASLLRGSLTRLVEAGTVTEDEAAALDADLARLIADGQEPELVDEELTDLLAAKPALLDWAAAVLAHPDRLPPEVAPDEPERAGEYERPAGDGTGVEAQRYACPVAGDKVWFRMRLSDSVPECRTHGVPLELVTT